MRKLWIAVLLLVVVAAVGFSVQTVKRSLFGEEKESFTFEGTVNATNYFSMPSVPALKKAPKGRKIVARGVTPWAKSFRSSEASD